MAHRSHSSNPFIRSALRQVRETLPRFLSILLITLIGVMFFAGLRLTSPFMKDSAERWLDDRNFMDVQIVSTMGFNEDDVTAIRRTPGVTQVSPGYTANMLVKRNGLEMSVRLVSFDTSGSRALNSPELLSGRLPEKDNECLAEEGWLRLTDSDLGSIVRFYSGTSALLSDTLAQETFTIVGVARTALFLAEDRGNSDIGAGYNRFFFLVLPQAFTLEVYTVVYLQVDLEEGGAALSRFDDEYFDVVAPTTDAIKKTGSYRSTLRYESIIRDATKELDETRAEVFDGYQELKDAQLALDDAARDLARAFEELLAARNDLDLGWAELSLSRFQLDNGWAELADSRSYLDSSWDDLNTERANLDGGWAAYEQQCAQLELAWTMGLMTQAQYEAALLLLEPARQQLLAGEAAYTEGRLQLEAGEVAYAYGRATLQAGESAWFSGYLSLLDGEASYEEGWRGYQQGVIDYEEAKEKFESRQREALEELARAEKDLAQAEKDLAALEPPRWYVLDLESNPGFRSFMQQSAQMESIATVIPLLFFLIAALVSMTTMTRLVDHDRTIIGTYKALGYTNRAITTRYLIYAASATVIGGILGIIVGINLFPPLIFNAFRTLFCVPPGPLYFSWPYAILSIVFALVSTVGPAAVICLRILRETPASAMRPLAPRPGKRIILERIRPLWSRLSFLPKITARNLLRYKKRAAMTIFGVGGCTALIFTGFGMNDSLVTIGPKQYGQIERYDVAITFRPSASTTELDELFSLITTSPELSSFSLSRRETVNIVGENLTKDLSIIASDDIDAFSLYYQIRPHNDSIFSETEPYALSDAGVILTEQIARQIGVAVGDTIRLRNLNDEEALFVVQGISENYVYHYVYMTAAVFEQGFGKIYEPNQILGLFNSGYRSMPESLTDLEAVTGIGYVQKRAADFSTITDVLGFVMVILIVSAAALLFVVLFSLNTINREERTRELASIKVLGFFSRELAAYIYREGFLLTGLGIALGLALGIGLERYIISTIEIDVFMFSYDLLWTTYVYSAVITAAFAVVVNILLYRPLTQIDMVSSLKAVE